MPEKTVTAAKRILLFGSTGQVGWELQRTLCPLGRVLAPVRQEVDLSNPDAIREYFRRCEPHLIVNAAAYTQVDQAEDEPALAIAINGTAPGVMAEEAKRLAIPLVHYSTDYVFDGATDRPYTEADTPNPINHYGRSKLAGEQAIRAVAPIHLILRTSWVYSKRGNNFLLTIMRLAKERDELRIVDDQTGSPTWARAIAEATTAILARTWNNADDSAEGSIDDLKGRSGIYHLSAGGSTSWFGFAKAIIEASTMERRSAITPIGTADYPTPAKRPAYSVLDTGAAHNSFGIGLPNWQHQLTLCLTSSDEPLGDRSSCGS